jgi:hypothetical protein
MSKRKCSAQACGRPHHAKGYCSMHASRVRRGTCMDKPRRLLVKPGTPLDEQLIARTDRGHPDGCWVWTGATTGNGYGAISAGDGRTAVAHRVAYEHHVGKIPGDLVCDHLCRNRACINPGHIELVTSGENVLRGVGPTAVNKAKTHCLRGHPFSGRNLIITKRGWRQCRKCRAIRKEIRRAAAAK